MEALVTSGRGGMERIWAAFLEIEMKSMLLIKFALGSGFARFMEEDRSLALF